jgi:hypothetical protein
MSTHLLMAVGDHGHLDVGFTIGALALRVALLAVVPVVAAFAVLRGFLGEPSRFTTLAVSMAAATAAAMVLLLSGGLNLPEQTIPLLLAALALPMYLVMSRDERFAAAVGLGRRLAPLVCAALAALAAVQFGLAWLGGAGRDRTATLLHTGVLLGLVALVWFAIARPRGRGITMGLRVGAALLGMGLLAGTAQAITMREPDSVPGVATEARLEVGGTAVDVLVAPNLPGWNLVHVSSAAVSVGTAGNTFVPTRSRADVTGQWLVVDLPAGRSDVWVRYAGQTGTVTTDTGTAGAAPKALIGADGPECVSAMLGRMLAGAVAGTRCPSDRLDGLDTDALATMVDDLAAAGHHRLALASDDSPRGVAATAAVRAAAADLGVELVAPGVARVPLLLTSGWSHAATMLRRVAGGGLAAEGTYLAPWLFSAPLQAVDARQHVAVRFAVSDESYQRYVTQLRRDYPAQAPSATGYRAWLTERSRPVDGAVRLVEPAATVS